MHNTANHRTSRPIARGCAALLVFTQLLAESPAWAASEAQASAEAAAVDELLRRVRGGDLDPASALQNNISRIFRQTKQK